MFAFEKHPELKQGRIDLWFANIDRLASNKENFEAVLSTEETTRAKRFRFLRDCNRYVIQHGVLRKLLAGYVGCDPEQVDIRTNANGKPYLAGQKSDTPIQFSLSHSEDFALYALSLVDRIGVDIEKIHEIPDMHEVVEQHFTRREKHEVLCCPEDQRLKLFYRFWTRKEAVLKAQGDGLLKALDSVDVAGGEGPGPWKVGVPVDAGVEAYSLSDVEGPEGFSAALAVAGSVVNISIEHHMIIEI